MLDVPRRQYYEDDSHMEGLTLVNKALEWAPILRAGTLESWLLLSSPHLALQNEAPKWTPER